MQGWRNRLKGPGAPFGAPTQPTIIRMWPCYTHKKTACAVNAPFSNPGRQSRHWILPVPDYYGTRGVRCKFTAKVTINVPLHGAELYVVNHNGEPYTPMKPIVEGMGMVWAAQFVKLKQRFVKGISEIEIPSAGGKQLMICLAFRKFAAWLSSIQPNKVCPVIRESIETSTVSISTRLIMTVTYFRVYYFSRH